MKPLRLYIKNFLCYEKAYIDFTEFSSALVVGKKENNDMYSNGVGKTTIFYAMEYVMFNHSDGPLEKIIRDDTNECQVVFDFSVDNQEYRLVRSYTRKGTSDLKLLERTAIDGSPDEVWHDANESPYTDKKKIEKFWKDRSGSRAGDTEKELAKLIKLNHKAFTSTVLFPQNDTSGLPNLTPEKRKAVLKDSLDLLVYSKLEKIAKERASALSKEIDKNTLILENLGNPEEDIVRLNESLTEVSDKLVKMAISLEIATVKQTQANEKVAELVTQHSNLESQFASLVLQEKSLLAERTRAETSVKEYTSKKSNVTNAAKALIQEVKDLKTQQAALIAIDFSQIEIVSDKVTKLKEQVGSHNATIKRAMEEYEELKIPLPSGSKCKNCRKPMTAKDREDHQKHIAKDMEALQETIKSAKKSIAELNAEILKNQQDINGWSLSKQQLEGVNTKITAANKEIQDKKSLHDEYLALLEKFKSELETKTADLESVQKSLQSSSREAAAELQKLIDAEKKLAQEAISVVNTLNKEISHFTSQQAIINHSITQKNLDVKKKKELSEKVKKDEEKFSIYPSVIQGFSTTGIPNLIIQNILDDLQIEANKLLSQLKPGLQLSFVVEKTVKKTGDQTDTLEIIYQINGKERYYKRLSGAMQLAVAFSLKLGLSFLLQNTVGTDIKFLLLDEIDQSLDKASVDAFSDIVKFFQKDFTILIITHNDRLKDKFSHAILVEQDINMVSRASVVSSW